MRSKKVKNKTHHKQRRNTQKRKTQKRKTQKRKTQKRKTQRITRRKTYQKRKSSKKRTTRRGDMRGGSLFRGKTKPDGPSDRESQYLGVINEQNYVKTMNTFLEARVIPDADDNRYFLTERTMAKYGPTIQDDMIYILWIRHGKSHSNEGQDLWKAGKKGGKLDPQNVIDTTISAAERPPPPRSGVRGTPRPPDETRPRPARTPRPPDGPRPVRGDGTQNGGLIGGDAIELNQLRHRGLAHKYQGIFDIMSDPEKMEQYVTGDDPRGCFAVDFTMQGGVNNGLYGALASPTIFSPSESSMYLHPTLSTVGCLQAIMAGQGINTIPNFQNKISKRIRCSCIPRAALTAKLLSSQLVAECYNADDKSDQEIKRVYNIGEERVGTSGGASWGVKGLAAAAAGGVVGGVGALTAGPVSGFLGATAGATTAAAIVGGTGVAMGTGRYVNAPRAISKLGKPAFNKSGVDEGHDDPKDLSLMHSNMYMDKFNKTYGGGHTILDTINGIVFSKKKKPSFRQKFSKQEEFLLDSHQKAKDNPCIIEQKETDFQGLILDSILDDIEKNDANGGKGRVHIIVGHGDFMKTHIDRGETKANCDAVLVGYRRDAASGTDPPASKDQVVARYKLTLPKNHEDMAVLHKTWLQQAGRTESQEQAEGEVLPQKELKVDTPVLVWINPPEQTTANEGRWLEGKIVTPTTGVVVAPDSDMVYLEFNGSDGRKYKDGPRQIDNTLKLNLPVVPIGDDKEQTLSMKNFVARCDALNMQIQNVTYAPLQAINYREISSDLMKQVQLGNPSDLTRVAPLPTIIDELNLCSNETRGTLLSSPHESILRVVDYKKTRNKKVIQFYFNTLFNMDREEFIPFFNLLNNITSSQFPGKDSEQVMQICIDGLWSAANHFISVANNPAVAGRRKSYSAAPGKEFVEEKEPMNYLTVFYEFLKIFASKGGGDSLTGTVSGGSSDLDEMVGLVSAPFDLQNMEYCLGRLAQIFEKRNRMGQRFILIGSINKDLRDNLKAMRSRINEAPSKRRSEAAGGRRAGRSTRSGVDDPPQSLGVDTSAEVASKTSRVNQESPGGE